MGYLMDKFRNDSNFRAGAGSLLLGGLSSLSGVIGQGQTNKQNLELAKRAEAHDLAMYNLNNQYNSPIEQMKRLKAAGLNPQLVYGSGSVSGNTSGSRPITQTPSYDSPLSHFKAIDPMSMISMYQNIEQTKLQNDNIEKANALKDLDLVMKKIDADNYARIMGYKIKNLDLTGQKMGFDMDYKATMMPYQVEAIAADVNQKKITAKRAREFLPYEMKGLDTKNKVMWQQLRRAIYEYNNIMPQTQEYQVLRNQTETEKSQYIQQQIYRMLEENQNVSIGSILKMLLK